MATYHTPALGLDATGQRMLDEAIEILVERLTSWQMPPALVVSAADDHEARLALGQLIAQRERSVSNCSSPDYAQLAQGARAWRTDYLLPLAHRLNLFPQARLITIQLLRDRASFDLPLQRAGRIDQHAPFEVRPVRPERRAIFPKLRALLKRVPDTDWATALVREGICRNRGNAQAVVALIKRSQSQSDKYTLYKCWQFGLFDCLPDQLCVRPSFEAILATVARILKDDDSEGAVVHALEKQKLCRTRELANAVWQVKTSTPDESTLRVVLRRCWKEGLFDRRPPSQEKRKLAKRPDPATLLRALLAAAPAELARPEQAKALVRQLLARDEETAASILAALDQSEPDSLVCRTAAQLVDVLLRRFLSIGRSGLLNPFWYPSATTLFLLDRLLQRRQRWAPADERTNELLRRDCIALHTAFASAAPKLWTRDLLMSPALSENRRLTQQRLTPEQRDLLLQAVTATHGAREAETLVDLLLRHGLPAVIDWRYGIPLSDAGTVWDKGQFQALVDMHLAALHGELHAKIKALLEHLRASLEACNITVSLRRILNEQPYSPYRRRLKRRLPVSYAVVTHYQRLKAAQRTRGVVKPGKGRHRRRRLSPILVATATLVAEFAQRAGLRPRDAAALLWNVWTYGAIGFLQRKTWVDAVHPRPLTLLRLYKLGRIEGRFVIGEALHRVNAVNKQLGRPEWSPQLAKALTSTQRKPGRWNQGESEKVAAVRARAGLVLPGTPWLHRVWRILRFSFSIPVAPSAFSPAAQTVSLLVVLDLGSQLPVGLWASTTPPEPREARLALFQAIWHLGALDWPLRGIPEVIQMPESLVGSQHDAWQIAADWLMASFHVVTDKAQDDLLQRLPTARAIITDLGLAGADELRRRAARLPMSIKDIHDAILAWLRKSPACYGAHYAESSDGTEAVGGHRPGLPDPSEKDGYAAPAYDTPVAAVLLPPASTLARTVRNGVLIGDLRFTARDFVVEPGQSVHVRQFPYHYTQEESLFVELPDGSFHYLTRAVSG